MEKKNKVTKVTKFDKKDDYGNTSYAIEFDGGDKGFYSTKDENQKHFVTGEEAAYVLEEKDGKKGKYYKVKVPGSNQPFSKGGKPAFIPVDPRIQMISFSTSYAKDLVVADKIKMADLAATSESIFKNMIKLYDTIK